MLDNKRVTHEAAGLSMGIHLAVPIPNNNNLVISKKAADFQNGLGDVNLENGQITELVSSFVGQFIFTPDGESIVYSLNEEFIAQNLNNAEILKYAPSKLTARDNSAKSHLFYYLKGILFFILADFTVMTVVEGQAIF